MSKYSKEIIELRKRNKTYKEIAKKLNCSISTISYHCTLHHLGGNNDKVTKEEEIKLQKLYDKYQSVNEVYKITGRARSTILSHIKLNKNKAKQTNSKSVILWRKRAKQKLVDYKGGKCEICGYNKCIEALHFHHRNSDEKNFSISGKSLSFEKLKIEADKCILVCSNCHSEIHAGIMQI